MLGYVHDDRLLLDVLAVRDRRDRPISPRAVRAALAAGLSAVRPCPTLPLTLGTAGHIDHGKTALITRLTGTNTDRLREERERGISIELGYAELELPGGRRVSVVDVPGHERFVRTMVAGATGIDLFLLVVAADDGVMPQTVEHLAVIELLGVERGVVALTKADLVDDELLELARADVERFLADTPFADAPIVVVSARDGRGLPELLEALAGVAGEVAAGRRDGPARLPVDRVFALRGFGTVVTGTLWRGAVSAGDRLDRAARRRGGDGARRADARPAGRHGAGRPAGGPEPARRRPGDPRARRFSGRSGRRRPVPAGALVRRRRCGSSAAPGR